MTQSRSISTLTLPLDQPIRSSIFWPNLESSLLQALFLGSTDHFCFLRAGHKRAASLHNSHIAKELHGRVRQATRETNSRVYRLCFYSHCNCNSKFKVLSVEMQTESCQHLVSTDRLVLQFGHALTNYQGLQVC